MADDFKVGDVVVCIISGETICQGQVARISGLRLDGPSRSRLGRTSYGVFLEGFRSVGLSGSYDPKRFRKLDAPRTEIADRIRACQPSRLSVPA